MEIVTVSLCSYLLGSIPTALIIVFLLSGRDVRSGGSGNMGAMNTVRMLKKHKGMAYAILGFLIVWIFDMLKAVAAVILALYFISDFSLAVSLGTFFAIVGHNYPIFLKFKGGRGAASFMGILLYFSARAFILWILTIFVFMLFFELLQTAMQKKKVSGKLVLHAISEQIVGRLVGELTGIYVVYLVDNRLLYPALCGTFLIILSHHKRLRDQINNLKR